jgi:hypothetical protein
MEDALKITSVVTPQDMSASDLLLIIFLNLALMLAVVLIMEHVKMQLNAKMEHMLYYLKHVLLAHTLSTPPLLE